ncbi:DUF3078 domain-containing protein [Flagellimonas allohymeniacidonis]|uniref:DUF3078 domain-containing protein n=1 Tax=Flagellimonas allohymeniacidonis TaxID=2517819 RepID=A0A4Q8QEX1_9FLAO|nr:DUF3078 domain-containing protein [Allomuricauda hymeniacidonis]TAI48197.1 DUF3078 domain-containing protein [Allomuricauda hymeniacidonis]
MRLQLSIVVFICSLVSLTAQVNTLRVFERDSTEPGFQAVRIKDVKLLYVPRSAKLTNSRTLLNRTKPLLKKYKRFVAQSFWTKTHEFGLNINEVAFVNWNAGGDNSVSALANMRFERNYKFRYLNWDNELRLRYGLNAQEGRALRKTDDQIRLTSTFGFRKDTITNWYYSVKMNFNTQFSNGFKYPDRSNPISRFMSPGYLFLGAGTSYILTEDKFNLYISPITMKATFVLDEALSNQGAFGVEEGEQVFMELGFLVTHTWEKEVIKNVLMNHRISLYTDYLRSFGNIDVDWEVNFNLKVNKYINANIGTHLIFDDDIKFDEEIAEDGTVINPGEPRIQFKQLLGIGMTYSF